MPVEVPHVIPEAAGEHPLKHVYRLFGLRGELNRYK
jgi:hypothetical protein